jgi:DNA-binding SARP family transcriptional activator
MWDCATGGASAGTSDTSLSSDRNLAIAQSIATPNRLAPGPKGEIIVGDSTHRRPEVKVQLLGSFGVRAGGQRVSLPPSTERLVGALALSVRDQDRDVLTAKLYPDAPRSKVMACLRSAIWRVKAHSGHDLVETCGQRLRLARDVEVDLHVWEKRARRWASSTTPAEQAALEDGAIEALSQELLPGWAEEWLLVERQRWDEVRLGVLEVLTHRLTREGRYMEALLAGLAAVSIEPYRESAHRALISAHIAQGNIAKAIVHYQRYTRLLTQELGLRPSVQIRELLRGLTVD